MIFILNKLKEKKGLRNFAFRFLLPIFSLFLLFSIVIPSREYINIMIAGRVASKVEGMDKLPANLVSFLNKRLEELSRKEGDK